jgi:hypothetical protein
MKDDLDVKFATTTASLVGSLDPCALFNNNPTLRDPEMLALLSNKVIKSVQKEHMTTFHKRMPICDLALGLEFLQQYRFITTLILIQK